MKRPFLPATFYLLFALVPMYLMHRTMAGAGFPPSGFGSAVLQAEFHLNDIDVYDLYGAKATPARAVLTEKMREAHVYDNLFLLCYGLFLIVFAFQGFRLTHWWRFLTLMFLAVVAVLADLIENGAIVDISRALDAGESDFSFLIRRLAFFTWVKWLSLALYFGFLIRFFNKAPQWGNLKKWVGNLLAWVCAAAVLVSFAAFGTRSAIWENRMSQAVTLLFAVLFVFSLFYRKKNDAQ
jgi:hypothetical protein